MSDTRKDEKLGRLVEIWGAPLETLLKNAAYDSVCPAICMNPACDFSTEYEPDQRAGWCDVCDTPSVTSVLVLAGLI